MFKLPHLIKITIARARLHPKQRLEHRRVLFHLVEIVLVQLSDKGSKVRVSEMSREDVLCEFVHVLVGGS